MEQRFPTSSEISAALAALGVYAEVPSERDLAEQACAVGGETVLAAVLANALFGAAIGCGMLAEGRMLESGTKPGERLSLARAQALRASGAEGVRRRGSGIRGCPALGGGAAGVATARAQGRRGGAARAGAGRVLVGAGVDVASDELGRAFRQ